MIGVAGVDARGTVAAPVAAPLRRFHGSVELDPVRLSRDAGRIHEEVVQHFSSLQGVTVKATLEIEANLPTGASEELIRTITENCRTLRFSSQEFEEA